MNIVIVGGGLGGVSLAKKLAKNKSVNVTIVDRNNYHFFPPLIYQVATAFVETSIISYPFRRMFSNTSNFRFHYGEMQEIDVARKVIVTEFGEVPYDYAVLAMGTETNYFGMANVTKNAVPMKTLDDAMNLRNRILANLEKASQTEDPELRKKLLTVVLAGGGPTGVELAGMYVYLNKHLLPKEYPELLRDGGLKIILVDMLPVLLGPMSKTAQSEALEVLQKRGVEVRLNTGVKDFVDGRVQFADGSFIETDTLIWTSGVIAREAKGLPEGSTGRARRILVDEYNKVQTVDDVYAIGDICFQTTDAAYPNGHPQLAQVAMQQGDLLASNLINKIEGRPLKPFAYFNKGSMAIISKNSAVVDLPKFSFTGFFAWITWLGLHWFYTYGFRNKVKLFNGWLWSWLGNNTNLRFIYRDKEKEQQSWLAAYKKQQAEVGQNEQ
ncbi:NAD(P)/FAD-dependent oxidoreductase [Olivibacter sitiensis]|uniref:NAD(P)/FAD-dependent oxidoreductase n=1 Tax=Olivibacter sitiensis TaxID=376470 RepID=UPI0003F6AA40|nr:NAD(P)/FAD-dependent oxidoreductase [Olivibacter sitiensis]